MMDASENAVGIVETPCLGVNADQSIKCAFPVVSVDTKTPGRSNPALLISRSKLGQPRLVCTKRLQLYNCAKKLRVRLCRNVGICSRVTTPLMPFHVAAHTESLSTSRLRALVGLLSSMAVTMNAKTAGSGKGLVAS